MATNHSILDRAGLSRESARSAVADALVGADDGELYLEYSQSEGLLFDNGRLKSASFDTSQGFGLRAVAGALPGAVDPRSDHRRPEYDEPRGSQQDGEPDGAVVTAALERLRSP